MDLNQQRVDALQVLAKSVIAILNGDDWTGNYIRILHLRLDDAWREPCAWTIYQKRKPYSDTEPIDKNIYVRRVIWQRSVQQKLFQSNNPNDWNTSPLLDTREAILDTEAVKNLLQKGKQMPIPVIGIDFMTVLDGANYSLRFGDGHDSAYLKWSGVNEWEALEDWFHEVTYFLDKALATS
jgi:hypothetical protein